jgi:hypothetical protein
MGAWELLEEAIDIIGLTLLALTLRWAAIERARVHRWRAQRRGEQTRETIDWGAATAVVGRNL